MWAPPQAQSQNVHFTKTPRFVCRFDCPGVTQIKNLKSSVDWPQEEHYDRNWGWDVIEQKELVRPALVEPNTKQWELQWKTGYLIDEWHQENGDSKAHTHLWRVEGRIARLRGLAGSWLVRGEVRVVNHFFRSWGQCWGLSLCPIS